MLPEVLALVLAAVGGAAVVHVLLATGRRHGRDLAVLTVLGATPGQVRATLAVAALATVLPAVLVGVPVGLGVARIVWWEIATSTGVGGDVAVPVAVLVAIGPGLLVGALLAAAVPAARAVRTPPATVLAGTHAAAVSGSSTSPTRRRRPAAGPGARAGRGSRSPCGKNRSSTLIPPAGSASIFAIQAPTPCG